MEMEFMKKSKWTKNGKIAGGVAAGSILAGFLAASCCVGPPLFALFGASAMGLITTVMPHQTEIITMSIILLGAGFFFAYIKPGVKCATCEPTPSLRRTRKFVWLAAVLVTFFTAAPYLRLLLT